ncbi:MAG: aminotransferase class IV [Blastocatellia bacterium]|nr:aminotransferase class IV [Blastocatellia bacterium]
MDRSIYYNGRVIDATEARVSPTVAGLLYGWGVFTTARIYDGQVFALDRHWERLLRDSEKARVPLPLDIRELKRAMDELISVNLTRQGRVRITVLRGDAGGLRKKSLWRIEQGPEAETLIFTSAEQTPRRRDLTITLSPYRLLSSGPLAGVKCTAMLDNLLAYEEARSRGFAEAIMLNERGEMTGATAANLFWVERDEIFTPSQATGSIAGVTRGMVYLIARKMGIHLVEGGFPVQRLLDASEVFLTSTAREIASVASFDIKHYDRKQARVTRHISREFQKMIRNAGISR